MNGFRMSTNLKLKLSNEKMFQMNSFDYGVFTTDGTFSRMPFPLCSGTILEEGTKRL